MPQAKYTTLEQPHLNENRSKEAVSFRPEQDSFIVLRSGETPAFRDADRMNLLTGDIWLFGQALSHGDAPLRTVIPTLSLLKGEAPCLLPGAS